MYACISAAGLTTHGKNIDCKATILINPDNLTAFDIVPLRGLERPIVSFMPCVSGKSKYCFCIGFLKTCASVDGDDGTAD